VGLPLLSVHIWFRLIKLYQHDLAKAFDKVPHRRLMEKIAKQIV